MAKAFISYSHRNERALERLHTHLAMLRRDGAIAEWYDREILAGRNVDREIRINLDNSDIFIALVSPDFLASNYCYEREMAAALERHEAGTLQVVPIIIEACDWSASPLGKLKALPKDGKPISTWTNEDVAYLDVVTELRRLLTATNDQDSATAGVVRKSEAAPQRLGKRYRIKKEFDAIDRADFAQAAFIGIRDYFERSIDELNQIGDPVRARFERMSDSAFTCTVLNKGGRNREAHITVHLNGERTSLGDITYSFSLRAQGNSANGTVDVRADEYEQYLVLNNFHGFSEREKLTDEQAAEEIWRDFIAQAGIDHD